MSRAWRIEFLPRAERRLGKLPERDRTRILRYLSERVAVAEDPRSLGEALKGPLSGLWRYRLGDFRIIVRIEDRRVTVLVLEIGHRREVYR
ncbi:MAG TPA: type II toxin-antitoxin system RelE/ParE family toxin [Propylenella sp.]